MGCSDSKAIDNSDTSVQHINSDEPMKKAEKSSSKAQQTITTKQWFDEALILPPGHGTPYTQSPLPSHYIHHQVSFDNENVDSTVWDRKLTIKQKNDTPKAKPKGSENEISWHYRKIANKKYSELDDTLTVDVEFEAGSSKKQIIALGGFYVGSCSAVKLDIFSQVDTNTTYAVVLLGNVFDTQCTDALHQAPSDITKIEEQLISLPEDTLASIKKLAEEVKVYYLQGSADCLITRSGMERLLGDKITFVPQKHLVFSLKVSSDPYRLLFTTGQHWDFLNCANLPEDQLLVGKPIGYYLSRASAHNSGFSVSNLIRPIATKVPDQLTTDFLQQISKRPLQDRLSERLLMSALQMSDPEHLLSLKCVVDQGKYISLQSIQEYPFLKYLRAKVGEETLMGMFKAFCGDYSSVAKPHGEDVLISGLGDSAMLSKVKTDAGQEMICATTGSCSSRAEKMTLLRVTFPKQGSNGKVEIVEVKGDAQTAHPTENGKAEPIKPADDNNKADTISVESL